MKFHARISFLFLILNSTFSIGLAPSALAQIQQAWVARYSNGIPAGNHQALKIALDSIGNIYLSGFSQESNSSLDYVTLKYAPNGNQVWAARFASTNVAQAKPTAFVLDPTNNVIVTGNAGTVKYASDGGQLWIAPYAGLSVASDSNANVIVTGFGTNFDTVKLTPNGSNLWQRTYGSLPAISQAVVTDPAGNVYVSGSGIYDCDRSGCYAQFVMIKFDPSGGQVWSAGNPMFGYKAVQVARMLLDSDGCAYVLANFEGVPAPPSPYATLKYSGSGALIWSQYDPTANGSSLGLGMAVDNSHNVLVTGRNAHYPPLPSYGTYKIDVNGNYLWTNLYPVGWNGSSVATSVALDQAKNAYITGFSPGQTTSNDIVTIAYDTGGKQLWLQRYDGPAHGDDAGNAIAADNHGNVYVAGYETVPGGGTEMVLIKYAPVTIQKQGANMLLQAQGGSGEPFDIQASTNLQTWLDLGTNHADTNGLLQYLDTNASLFPWRFYLAIPQ